MGFNTKSQTNQGYDVLCVCVCSSTNSQPENRFICGGSRNAGSNQNVVLFPVGLNATPHAKPGVYSPVCFKTKPTAANRRFIRFQYNVRTPITAKPATTIRSPHATSPQQSAAWNWLNSTLRRKTSWTNRGILENAIRRLFSRGVAV